MDRFRIDSTKIQFHPQRVAQWLDSGDDWEKAKKVYPPYWEITTSAACNHRCTFCSVDAIGYPAILIEPLIIIQRMKEAKSLGVKSVMYAGTGEPLSHKRINTIVGAVMDIGLDQAFTTNGVLLDKLARPEYCSWIKVSLNAGTKKSYAQIHQTDEKDWDKVWANIKDLMKRRGGCSVGIQCVVLPENYMDMANLAYLARDAGVDYFVMKPYSQGTFSIIQRHDINYAEMEDELQAVTRFSTPEFQVVYRENAVKQEMEDHHYEKCLATPFFWTYSMADGRVFTCSAHLLDERFCIGNLNEQSFQEIWEGEGRRKQWELMKEFDIKQCRKNCRMNSVNIYLDQLKHQVPHVNFI
jgi:radical SAM protein with 4Fe4S-binding SPASM domain